MRQSRPGRLQWYQRPVRLTAATEKAQRLRNDGRYNGWFSVHIVHASHVLTVSVCVGRRERTRNRQGGGGRGQRPPCPYRQGTCTPGMSGISLLPGATCATRSERGLSTERQQTERLKEQRIILLPPKIACTASVPRATRCTLSYPASHAGATTRYKNSPVETWPAVQMSAEGDHRIPGELQTNVALERRRVVVVCGCLLFCHCRRAGSPPGLRRPQPLSQLCSRHHAILT